MLSRARHAVLVFACTCARPRTCAWACIAALVVAGCAPRRLALPTGAGAPFPDYQVAFDQASAACRAVRSLTAELGLSGRVGGQKLRGRVLAGLAEGGDARLEAVAPFGAPVFILVARANRATLVLPREARVLSGQPPAAILDALVGVDVSPDNLRALVAGCPVVGEKAVAGRAYADGWVAVELAGGGTAYLRRAGARWRIAASAGNDLAVEYREPVDGFPRRLRVWSDTAGARRAAVDLAVTVSQLETNMRIDPAAFDVQVPPDAVPLTLDELRRMGWSK